MKHSINKSLAETDSIIANAIKSETFRQNQGLEMIASENFVSRAVMEACGSVMTNKYAEGYPNKRYYGGCENMDVVEEAAIERAKMLFGAEHVNVQPHSGAQANMAVFLSVLKPNDTFLGMEIAQGGHLSHGHALNFSGLNYNAAFYGVKQKTGIIDYDSLQTIAEDTFPKLIVCGASAYSRKIDFKRISQIAKSVGSLVMADIAHIAGLVAAGLHESPVPYCDFVTTTTHKTLRGPRGGMIMCKKEFAKQIDRAVFPGIQGGPLMHIIAAKAVAFKEALEPEFKDYQKQVIKNAQVLADVFKKNNIRLVANGTDNHLLLLDVFDKGQGITGKESQSRLDEVFITVNKNLIPFDLNSASVTSGIRIGTPALTSRGMKEAEMEQIALLIIKTIRSKDFDNIKDEIKLNVLEISSKFPLYKV